jgi:hypothetical protein
MISKQEAKKMFIASDCSTFIMARENLPLYKKYLNAGIDSETELKWEKECFQEILNSYGEYANWKKISKLHDLAQSINVVDFYHEIKNELYRIQSTLAINERMIIAETLIGRLALSQRSGLIFEAYDIGDIKLSWQFSEMADALLMAETDDAELQIRINNAKENLAEIKRILK